MRGKTLWIASGFLHKVLLLKFGLLPALLTILLLASPAQAQFQIRANIRGAATTTVGGNSGNGLVPDKLAEREEIAKVLQKVAEQEAWDRPLGDPPKDVPPLDSYNDKLIPWIEVAHTGWDQKPNSLTRYIVLRLVLINNTKESVTIKREQVSAVVDGTRIVPTEDETRLRNRQVTVQNRSYQIKDMKLPETWEIPAGEAAARWIHFSNIEMSDKIPPFSLELDQPDGSIVVDVTSQQRAALRLRTEEIGPRSCLCLTTIHGTINSFNVQALCDMADEVSSRGIERMVVAWSPEIKTVDQTVISWLIHAANTPGEQRGRINYMPEFPTKIIELQLASLPGGKKNYQSSPNIHDKVSSAVTEVLSDAYRRLPPTEVKEEVLSGNPLARPAALLNGAGNLPADFLPQVIELTRSDDDALANAAIIALGTFGDESARQTLQDLLKSRNSEKVSAAVEALATSRFESNQQALRDVLANMTTVQDDAVIDALAKLHLADWVDLLARYAHRPDGTLRKSVLATLAPIHHPSVFGLLKEGIAAKDPELRSMAFGFLIRRTDPASRKLAVEYALANFDSIQDDQNISQFLRRTRDARLLPHLLTRLDSETSNRTQTIRMIGHVGDGATGAKIAPCFDSTKSPSEKVAVLEALLEMDAPECATYAVKGLTDADGSVVNSSVQALNRLAPSNLIELLDQGLQQQKNVNLQRTILQGICQSGGSEARKILMRERNSKDETRAKYAADALRSLLQQSPAYQFYQQAAAYLEQKQRKSAAACFDLAIQMEDSVPEVYAGRGNLRLQDGKPALALADFEKAMTLDPTSPNSMAWTGKAIADVMLGNTEAGVKELEDVRERFREDNQFYYNAACVYGRALEQTAKLPEGPNRNNLEAIYQEKGLKDLKIAFERGFDDSAWAMEDPDLAVLRKLSAFREIVKNGAAAEDAKDE